ncbi:pyridoxamine 5'-phosphate oxidase family protein [Oceanicola sp. D3]|uniref:pyridoxamine 5'-phosphate oxidase family protein n=1 Tax=Oceanicola sp. D3 TaxID=2587163 RepID=UPI001122C153|nr:pyridoxamine 5'-phosphate oxidase family protein [Oceanicola sp. D3]QDC10782.1 pyridoxamine 5'-phosphate oxidase family protein [Oceanicola sp. D3]
MTRPEQVFHAGERAVQDRVGLPEKWRARAARAIRATMPEQHQRFFESQPMLFLGLRDMQGRPWATACMLPAAAQATPTRLTARARPVLAESIGLDLRPGANAAVLGLEFATRRRNRMNGVLCDVAEGSLSIEVEQSFGNCPKYIRTRDIRLPAAPLPPAEGARVALCDADAQRIISSADTFFIATHAKEGADVSHRGGMPGLLRQNADGSLSFPDYAGNRFYNTLGNIDVSRRAGLFIPDFTSGEAILLTGGAGIDWSPTRAAEFEQAERVVDIHPEEVWHVRHALPGGGIAKG